MMRVSVRVLAVMVLFLLAGMTSFADDGAKKSDTAAASAAAPTKSDAAEMAKPASVGLFPRPAPPRPSSSFSARSDTTPVVETFLGYSYLRFAADNKPLVPFPTVNPPDHFDLQGATEAIAGNINDWFGLVADFGQYNTWHLQNGVHTYTYLFGPQFSYRKHERLTPFFHALFGAASARGGQSLAGPSHQNSFATALGMGLDLKATQHVAFRLFQIEYFGTKFADTSKVQQTQNNVRLSGGLVFRFGHPAPPPPPPPPPVNHPPVASCSASPSSIIAGSGDTVAVRAQASDPDNDPLTYTWSASGGSVEGSGPEVRWNSGSAGPGSYTVTVRVDDGRGGTVSCSADVKVEPMPNRPPVISSCTAEPASVEVDQPVRISANASDPDNDPLTYSWQTSGGQLTGTGANVQLTSATPGRFTVKARVDDGRGGTADCETSAEFTPHKPTPIELRLALHSIYFVTAQPTPQNPTGGLVLSQQKTLTPVAADFKVYMQTHPDAKLILEGHADPRGGVEYNQGLSERRVQRTKKYLVDQGVPAASIETKAYGEQKNMTDAEVREAVNTNPDLTPGERKRIMANERIIILASNRRVDITLSTTGQTSIRHFPFSAEDALSLIGGREKPKPAARPAPRGARPGAGKAPGKAAGKAPRKAAPKKPQ
ncbi:MAG TPA: PKD domain-containing protein [Candidatus Acidoferrales bacterium]|nr:PKD domain-containing protein [Candidatus Acidoferrales bacterium]